MPQGGARPRPAQSNDVIDHPLVPAGNRTRPEQFQLRENNAEVQTYNISNGVSFTKRCRTELLGAPFAMFELVSQGQKGT